MMKKIIPMVLLLVCIFSGVSRAETAPAKQSAAESDKYGRDTPRGALEGFLKAAAAKDYSLAARFLDLRFFSEEDALTEGPRFAQKLKLILDRSLQTKPDRFSQEPAGNLQDGLSPSIEFIGKVKTPEKNYDVLLQRIQTDEGKLIWKIASTTVVRIPRMYEYLGFGILGKYFPRSWFEIYFAGFSLPELIVGLSIALIAFFLTLLISRGFLFLIRLLKLEIIIRVFDYVKSPVFLLIWASLGRNISHPLIISASGRRLYASNTIPLIALIWFVLRFSDYLFDKWMLYLQAKGLTAAAFLVPLAKRITKISALLIGITVWLENIGFQVTTILAGLGVGGIAIALASQKSLEDIFGAVSLFTSKPLKIGDTIQVDDKLGVVEEIGLRSTRIRTLQRTVIAIPNSQIASMKIENLSKRDQFLFDPKIGVRYETSPDQIRYLLMALRKMLHDCPDVNPDPARVRFTGFGDFSLNIEVFAYIRAKDYQAYLGIAEELNLRIMDIVNQAGTGFAFPSQVEYVTQDTGLNTELARQAEEAVAKLRKDQKL